MSDNRKQEQDRQFLQQCVELAVTSVASGGGPFSALIVSGTEVLAKSHNQVVANSDPTAHAEIQAIRQAARVRENPHLSDCVLYASCEPCPMCLAAAMWAHIPRIVFAAPHTEAVRAGFDDRRIALELYGQPTPVRPEPGFLQHLRLDQAAAPFDAWLAKSDRVEY